MKCSQVSNAAKEIRCKLSKPPSHAMGRKIAGEKSSSLDSHTYVANPVHDNADFLALPALDFWPKLIAAPFASSNKAY
jgi:hypothetical protein